MLQVARAGYPDPVPARQVGRSRQLLLAILGTAQHSRAAICGPVTRLPCGAHGSMAARRRDRRCGVVSSLSAGLRDDSRSDPVQGAMSHSRPAVVQGILTAIVALLLYGRMVAILGTTVAQPSWP